MQALGSPKHIVQQAALPPNRPLKSMVSPKTNKAIVLTFGGSHRQRIAIVLNERRRVDAARRMSQP